MSLLAATIQSVGGTISGFTFIATIDSALATYNVATAATAAGWNGDQIVTATITQASGGEITGTANNAFNTGVLPEGSTVALTIESSAFTRGDGGTGGEGGALVDDGSAGIDGRTAINFLSNGSITIDSGGEVSGGGGGGGGGGGFFVKPAQDFGGGGGGGFPNGAGGVGPFAATDGAAGTSGGGGAAGNSGSGSAGNGGAGGGAASAGSAGVNATGNGGAAGAAGSAIEKNGFTVTVNNSGTLSGDVNA